MLERLLDCRSGYELAHKLPVLPPLKHVCHQLHYLRNSAYELPVEVRKTEEDVDVTVALRIWPLADRLYTAWLHLDLFWSDDEADEANSVHVELALQQFEV